MRRARRVLGTTLIETTIGLSLSLVVIGVAFRLAQSSSDVARQAASHDVAARRAQQVLAEFADAVRSASEASMLHVDGTPFADATSDTGITVRRVAGCDGPNRLAAAMTLQFVAGAGGGPGEIQRVQDGVTQVLARGVLALTVRRAGDTITIRVTVEGGGRDDLDRTIDGAITVRTRNP